MTQLFQRFPRLSFFLCGFAVTALSFVVQVNWREIVGGFGLRVGYDTRPQWLVFVMHAITSAPWIAAAIVIALRVLKGKQYSAVAFSIGAVSVPITVIAMLWFSPIVVDIIHRQPFESSAWIVQEQGDSLWPARLTMIDDLVKRKLLGGKHKEEVVALLGEGTHSSSWREWDIHYWLGPERSLIRIDSEWLVIRFDDSGIVKEYAIVRD